MTGVLRSLPNKIATDSFGATRLIVLENTLAGPLTMFHTEPGVVIRQMEESDLKRFRETGSFITERRIADFAARLKSGRRAFIALSAGQVSGYGWLSRQAEIDARCGVEISPAEEEGYIYDGFVFPAFRGRSTCDGISLRLYRLFCIRGRFLGELFRFGEGALP